MNDTPTTPQVKKCYRCQQVKALDCFYNNKSARDGKTTYCAQCWSEYRKEKYKTDPKFRERLIEKATQWNNAPRNAEKLKAYKRDYSRRDYVKEKAAQERKTDKWKKKNALASKRYHYRNPLKQKARSRVSYLVLKGELPRAKDLLCTRCGKAAHHYHHYNGYEKEHWLDVKPYCRACHHKIHIEERKAQSS